MGFNFSRPQYDYYDRIHSADYFRVCDPSDCFCGGPIHYRSRHVAVHRLPGGQELYEDPVDFMDGLIGNYGGGLSGGGLPPLTAGYPSISPGMPLMTTGVPSMMQTPSFGMPGITSMPNANGNSSCWPYEPRDWTTRDFDRFGEMFGEFLTRQRGRMPGQQTSPLGGPMLDNLLDGGTRYDYNPQKPRQAYAEFEQLRSQMMRYAQEAKEHMQSITDHLYGSDREHREERYKDRQRKLLEEILRNLPIRTEMPRSDVQQPGQTVPGMFPGMSPLGAGQMGHPMAGMFPGMMDPMAAYANLEGLAPRQRQRRPARGLAFGEEGGFTDEFGGRRPRRGRRTFDEGDDDMMDLGDGRHFPNRPRRPDRGGRGGGGGTYGATFDHDRHRPDTHRSSYAQRTTPSQWEAYDPALGADTTPYRPPPQQPAYADRAQQAWPQDSHNPSARGWQQATHDPQTQTWQTPMHHSTTQAWPQATNSESRHVGRYAHESPNDQENSNDTRPHVSFQIPSAVNDGSDRLGDHNGEI